MAAGQGRSSRAEGFDERTVDDARSGLYGAIGNLYNLMDSLPQAMEYYAKAGEIFEKYGWNESNAILWYNLGETWLEEGDLRQAEDCYRKSLDYARASGDSLQISSPLKGLGSLYLKQGKTRKALRCLKEADRYYSLHQDQEFRARLETLDVMSQVLTEQKRTRSLVALAAIILLLLLLAMQFLLRRLRILQQEKQGADAVIDEVLSSLGPDPDETVFPAVAAPVSPAVPATPSAGAEPQESSGLFLSEREREVLTLIAAGLTSPQIAEHLYLSLPTIKWYRKRLLSKFGAANMADLVRRAKEEGII
jgi:DNA-binding NarL/FixJ family response regulator